MKKRKKKQRKTNFHSQTESKIEENITIFHSANADKPVGKLAKSSVLVLEPLHCENDEFDQNDELQNVLPVVVAKTFDLEKAQVERNASTGRVYPFDLWDVLSSHIRPEQVNVYARLCKDAYQSVNRVSFWIHLYQKYVSQPSSKNLPLKFQPDYITVHCNVNLRLHVIKALHFVYSPLKDRLTQPKNRLDPHLAVGMICQSAWTTRKANHYKFHFKMNAISNLNQLIARNTDCDEVLDHWEDFQCQPASIGPDDEESCHLLQFDCDAFALLPSGLSGLRILDFNVISSGEGFRYQSVTITLGPIHLNTTVDYKGRKQRLSPNTINLTIGNCLSIQFLPWFHPLHSC